MSDPVTTGSVPAPLKRPKVTKPIFVKPTAKTPKPGKGSGSTRRGSR